MIMKIFVVNAGSSSLKCALYELGTHSKKVSPALWEAHLQFKKGKKRSILKIKSANLDKRESHSFPNLKAGLNYIVGALKSNLLSLDEIDVVGHRVVHGGEKYTKSTLITSQVKAQIHQLEEIAPLHNHPALECIEVMEKWIKKPQVAVFDTAFHHTMPPSAYIYPGPYTWVNHRIRRYGFHGTSFQYCSQKAKEMCSKKNSKMVICHLGAGASLAAIKNGKSIDTTMGFTPLDGLMMDTRSGSIDPGIIFHLLKKMSAKEIEKELNEKSGLLGISGVYSDMREIEEHLRSQRVKLALDIYIHRLNACIGSMIASLQGIDALIFTGGIGENSSIIRKKVADSFAFLGLKIDASKNKSQSSEDRELSTPKSLVKVLLIHTQENFEIAKECAQVVKK
jgi:acetate kinase